ncbi:4-alpha-glucanotransferase [Verrucomicrobiota bacterium sgz303538]
MHLSPDQKLAGILAPLFALRSKNDLGVGDIGALREFIDWSAEHGFRVVQLLPVNETGNDNSPYNALSSVALDPTTIEITTAAIPDLREEDLTEMQRGIDIAVLRQGPVIYPTVKALKRNLLRRAFERFCERDWTHRSIRGRRFREFMEQEASWLDGYALFRVLMEDQGGTERWDHWPAEIQTASSALAWLKTLPAKRREELRREMKFVKYIQWIAWSQWREVREYAESRGVSLMGDVPFGVSYYSADVFSEPDTFDHKWSGGAPPEPLFKDDPFTVKWGQNWGVPLYRWEVLEQRNFDWWRQRVSKTREIFHLFRIDHVLGFYRIYGFPWRPQLNADFLPLSEAEAKSKTGGDLPRFHVHDDETPEHRELNRRHGERLLRALLEETGEHRLIGEDLGTVPPYVRPSLTSMGIAGFKIPQWEHEWNTHLVAGEKYQRLSVATYATHDHEPLRAMWERWMATIKAAEHGDPEAAKARDWVWWEVRRLGEWAGFQVPRITSFEDVHEELLEGLFRCNSWISICMITDLFATSQRFNVPGAVAESNWSQRLATPVSAWREDSDLAAKMARVHAILRDTGRVG